MLACLRYSLVLFAPLPVIGRSSHPSSRIGLLTFPRMCSRRTLRRICRHLIIFPPSNCTSSLAVSALTTSCAAWTRPTKLISCPAPPPPDSQNKVSDPQGQVPSPFVFKLSQVNATKLDGGSVKVVDSTTFPVSTAIAVAEVTVEPGAMRELHVSGKSLSDRLWQSQQITDTGYSGIPPRTSGLTICEYFLQARNLSGRVTPLIHLTGAAWGARLSLARVQTRVPSTSRRVPFFYVYIDSCGTPRVLTTYS